MGVGSKRAGVEGAEVGAGKGQQGVVRLYVDYVEITLFSIVYFVLFPEHCH